MCVNDGNPQGCLTSFFFVVETTPLRRALEMEVGGVGRLYTLETIWAVDTKSPNGQLFFWLCFLKVELLEHPLKDFAPTGLELLVDV